MSAPHELLVALQEGWLDSNYCELCRASLIPEHDGDNYGHEIKCLWHQARTELARYRMEQKPRSTSPVYESGSKRGV